jgi:hypothetical protein
MNFRIYAVTIAATGLSFVAGSALAQREVAGDADAPETVAPGISRQPSARRWKGFAPVPNATTTSPEPMGRQSASNQHIEGRPNPTYRFSRLIGTTITGPNGQPVGKVVDFVTDARGNIMYPIVSYSGSPGFSGKLFAVPYGSLRFATGGNNNSAAQLAFDPRLLATAPHFTSAQFPEFGDPAVQNMLRNFYQGALPATASVAVGGVGGMPMVGTSGSPSPLVNRALPLTSGQQPASVSSAGISLPGASSSPTGPVAGVPLPQATITGPSGSPAGSTMPGGTLVGPTGSPAGSTLPGGTVTGPSGSPSASTVPGQTVTSPNGSPAGSAPRGGTLSGPGGSPAGSTLPGASATGPSGSPAGSTGTGGSVIGPTGSPASGTAPAGTPGNMPPTSGGAGASPANPQNASPSGPAPAGSSTPGTSPFAPPR